MRVLFDLEEIAVIQRAVNRCFGMGIGIQHNIHIIQYTGIYDTTVSTRLQPCTIIES